MKKILAILMISAVLLGASACGETAPIPTAAPNTVAPTAEPAPETPAPVTIAVTTDTYAKTYTDDDGTELLNVSYAMPVVSISGREAAAEAINSFMENQKALALTPESEYNIGEADALEMAKEAREQGYFGEAYAIEQSFSMTRGDGAVLSLYGMYYGYMGGAHGSSVASGLNFDSETGEELTLSALSADSEALTAFCVEKVTALAEADAGDGRYWDNYKEVIPNNIRDGMWYFSDEGLTFIYNQYELGSYAAGAFEFTIPYAELAGVVYDKWLPQA